MKKFTQSLYHRQLITVDMPVLMATMISTKKGLLGPVVKSSIAEMMMRLGRSMSKVMSTITEAILVVSTRLFLPKESRTRTLECCSR